jgi:small subunit ribosomal protein S1
MEESRGQAPWEVPPDEAYWHALLQQGEYGDSVQVQLQKLDPAEENPVPEPRAADWREVGQASQAHEPDDPVEAWSTFVTHHAEEKPVELEVVGFNRGGLLVKWDGVTGFVPASQLCNGLQYDERSRQQALAERVGSTLLLKVIEVDAERDRLILSERAARRVDALQSNVLDRLNPGEVCNGHVTNLCDFGAFVDLGGVEGLIHISELSWGHVSHPADVLQSGQEVEVYVLNVNRRQERIGLSLKRLRPDPWNTVENRYRVGQIIQGTVTNIVDFGAFVRIERGLEGLIHASELANSETVRSRTLVEGESIQVQIVSIDGSRHRIGLTLA